MKPSAKANNRKKTSAQTGKNPGVGESGQPKALSGPAFAPFPKMISIGLIIILFLLGLYTRVSNLDNVVSRSPDEMTYRAQASVVAEKGIPGVKAMLRDFNAQRKLWDFPHPLRVGYLWPYAALMNLTHSQDVKVGAGMSCFFSVASLGVLIALGLRFFNPWITAYTLLCAAVSPMSLAIARRGWQEAMIECLGLLLIYFCGEITRDSGKRVWYGLVIALGSYYILIKSTCVVIYLLCIVWVLGILFVRDKAYGKGGLFLAGTLAGSAVSIAVLASIAGGFAQILEPIRHMKEASLVSHYALTYCSGPWYDYFSLIGMLNPVNVWLFPVGAAGAVLFSFVSNQPAALRKDIHIGPVRGIGFVTLAFLSVVFLVKPVALNLRYISALYVPFYLLSGLGAWSLLILGWAGRGRKFMPAVLACAVLALSWAAVKDYQRFEEVFVMKGIKDISIGLVRPLIKGRVPARGLTVFETLNQRK